MHVTFNCAANTVLIALKFFVELTFRVFHGITDFHKKFLTVQSASQLGHYTRKSQPRNLFSEMFFIRPFHENLALYGSYKVDVDRPKHSVQVSALLKSVSETPPISNDVIIAPM